MAWLKYFTNFSDSACKNGHPEGEWANVYYGYTCFCLPPSNSPEIWAEAWQNQQNDLCTYRRLSVWAFAVCREKVCPWLPIEHTAKTLLSGCPGWSESSLGTQIILSVLLCFGSYSLQKDLYNIGKTHTFHVCLKLMTCIVQLIDSFISTWYSIINKIYTVVVGLHLCS